MAASSPVAVLIDGLRSVIGEIEQWSATEREMCSACVCSGGGGGAKSSVRVRTRMRRDQDC